MTEFFQLFVNGLTAGAVLAISAVGITLIYGLLNIANFAHGDYLTLAAFAAFGFNVLLGAHIIIATLAAVATIAIFAVALEVIFWRPLRRRGARNFISLFLSSLGLALVIRYSLFLVAGPSSRSFAVDRFSVVELFGVRLSQSALIGIVITVIAMLSVGALLAYSTVGRTVRALGDNPSLAAVSGIDPNRITLHAWVIAGSLAGVAGVIQALVLTSFDANMGGTFILAMYVAVILGGIGDAYGALVAGLVVGTLTELSTWTVLAGGIDPRYKPIVLFSILAVVLVFRPYGILGRERLR